MKEPKKFQKTNINENGISVQLWNYIGSKMGDGINMSGGNGIITTAGGSGGSENCSPLTLWSAADRGDTARVRELLYAPPRVASHHNDANPWRSCRPPADVNARNCLGCTPLLYACGSGHLETVSSLINI